MLAADSAEAYGDEGDPNGDYYAGYDDLDQFPKWFEHGSVTADTRINAIQGISAVTFDPFEEVLWTGLQTGRAVSYLMPNMDKYTAFSACPGLVRQLIVDQDGLISLTDSELRCYSRGGLFQMAVSAQTSISLRGVMNCMNWLDVGAGTMLVGGEAGMSMVDVTAGGRVLKDMPLPGNVIALRRSRAIWCGYAHGAVAHLDTRTLRAEFTIDVHSGSLTDCDAKGDFLVTCGCSARKGQLYLDPIVKVFDVRTRSLITSVTVPTGNPYLLRFHPHFSSTLVAVSQTGGFQLCDVAGAGGGDMYFHIEIGEDVLTSFDISSTGEAMAFGDSGGYVHVWTDRTNLHVNMYSNPPEMPEPLPAQQGATWDETVPLSNYGLINMGLLNPPGSEALLSDWPPSLLYNVGLPPKPIDPGLLAQTRVLDFVGYIANPGYTRYQVRGHHIGTGYLKAQPGKTGLVHALPPGPVRPPKKFRWVEIKYSKLGLDDFNFGRYNRTPFAGLENSLPNSYCNSCLQALYFISHLRVNMLNHLCPKDFCLSCELGFLFHMLDKARGTSVPNVQASNFLRAFRQIPQAAALGLFQAPELSDTPLSQLIEGFNRFLLEQLNKELSPTSPAPPLSQPIHSPTPVDVIFGSTTTTSTRCQSCGHIHERTARTFQFELVYPVPPNTTISAPAHAAAGKPLLHSSPFTAAVTASLCREILTKAWCEKCCHYHPSVQRKTPAALPHILCLATGAARSSADLWRSPIPQRLVMRLTPLPDHSHAVGVGEFSDNDVLAEGDDLYELIAVIAHISDPSKKSPKPGHIVAQIRIPQNELPAELPEGMEPTEWFLFNDFRISPSNIEEVTNFDSSWRTCCVLYYKRCDMETRVPMPLYNNPITFDVFFAKSPFKSVQVDYLTRNDEFQKGDLTAIDAEFVSLGAEETELRSDGTRVIVNPAHFGLARVSVVKGDPPKVGSIFIDDYIVTPEPITDYLTRFSGIEIGDLDPNVSTKPLTNLKSVYLKLRYLVDRGVRLVGHGLAKDFRIINIVVPPDQIIDTVEIFHIHRQRKISLKFLAAFLLNVDIQTGTHNSIEDARTALALYKAYLGLTEAGQYEQMLDRIYHIGRLTNWSVEAIPAVLKNEKG